MHDAPCSQVPSSPRGADRDERLQRALAARSAKMKPAAGVVEGGVVDAKTQQAVITDIVRVRALHVCG